MSESIITCPFCGTTAVEGEFFKNGGCPRKGCKGHQNMVKYQGVEIELVDKNKKAVDYYG